MNNGLTNDEAAKIAGFINSMERIGTFCDLCRQPACICINRINNLTEKTMNHLFVNYTIARKLKEKGFNDECVAHFTTEYEIKLNNIYDTLHLIRLKAPMYQQVVDWFRETHKLFIYILDGDTREDNLFYWYQVGDLTCNGAVVSNCKTDYKTYYEALEKAIEEAIELIV